MKASEIVELAEKRGFVSVSLLMDELSLSREQAYRALQLCWLKELLYPTDRSWFAPPGGGRSKVLLSEEDVLKRRAHWYRPELIAIRKFLEDREEGVTVKDIEEGCGIPNARARNALYILVDLQELVVRDASAGGSYGKKPKIFGLDLDSVQARDRSVIETSKRKKKEELGRKQEWQDTRSKILESTEVQGEDEIAVELEERI